ncbi:MAG TPA: aroma-sacti cluster domain-containing protein [Candidatus Limnocylindrales bacterium]|nr:aroma-sacti cluster domain-containing protein [Candidatus Limnocylindrales bacterium]
MERTRAHVNVKKLQKAGILGTRQPLTPEDHEVIKSLSPDEVDAWVRIKKKLDDAGCQEPECKFFI